MTRLISFLRSLRHRIYLAITVPTGADAETEAWLADLRAARDWQPETIARPGIYVDSDGRTVVRDRFGVQVIGGDAS